MVVLKLLVFCASVRGNLTDIRVPSVKTKKKFTNVEEAKWRKKFQTCEFPSRPSTARQNCKDSLLVFKCFSTIRMYLKAVIQVKRNVDHWANMIQIPLLPTINLRKNPHLRNSKNKMHLQ